MKKTDSQIEKELEKLSDYELDEATAIAQSSLDNIWAQFVYKDSTPKTVAKVRKERPKTFVLNPPTPRLLLFHQKKRPGETRKR